MSTDEREDLSVPSSEDENKEKDTDTDYCPESAENFLSSEYSLDEGAMKFGEATIWRRGDSYVVLLTSKAKASK